MSPGPGKHREETRNECSRFLEYLKSSITPAMALTKMHRNTIPMRMRLGRLI